MFGIAENIIDIMSSSMPMWKTNLYANSQHLGSVSIKRGIFQGDSFSPLLFVITLIPITMVYIDRDRHWLPSGKEWTNLKPSTLYG